MDGDSTTDQQSRVEKMMMEQTEVLKGVRNQLKKLNRKFDKSAASPSDKSDDAKDNEEDD